MSTHTLRLVPDESFTRFGEACAAASELELEDEVALALERRLGLLADDFAHFLEIKGEPCATADAEVFDLLAGLTFSERDVSLLAALRARDVEAVRRHLEFSDAESDNRSMGGAGSGVNSGLASNSHE